MAGSRLNAPYWSGIRKPDDCCEGEAMAYGNADAVEVSHPSSPLPSNPTELTEKDKSAHLVFVGFVAMYDPPRKGVGEMERG